MQKGLVEESYFNATLHQHCFSALNRLGCFLSTIGECACHFPVLTLGCRSLPPVALACDSQHLLFPRPARPTELRTHPSALGPLPLWAFFFTVNALSWISSEVPYCPNILFYFYFPAVTTGARGGDVRDPIGVCCNVLVRCSSYTRAYRMCRF